MKKLLFILLFISLGVSAQDIVVLKHTNYISHYSISKRYPIMVEWTLTKSMVNCSKPLKRKDNFQPDPLLISHTDLFKDYIRSGYDRGHLMPAADNLCQTANIQNECFYFSNMLAQTHRLNAGDWKSLETVTRIITTQYSEIKIWAGGIGELKKIGKTTVPKQCYKIIYVKSTNTWYAYLFNNDESKPDGYENNRVDKSVIENLINIKFEK